MSIAARAMGALTNQKMVSDEQIHEALETLRKTATEIGMARQRMILATEMVKHIEALMMVASDHRSADMRKASARASEKYVRAIEEEAAAAGAYETLKAVREHAVSITEAWRTQESTLRSIKIG